MFLIIPAFVIIGWTTDVRLFYFGLFLYSISSAIVVPCLTTLASRFGPKDQKGVSLGIFRSIGSLARAAGPLFASAGNAFVGVLSVNRVNIFLPFIPVNFLFFLSTETSHQLSNMRCLLLPGLHLSVSSDSPLVSLWTLLPSILENWIRLLLLGRRNAISFSTCLPSATSSIDHKLWLGALFLDKN